MDVANRAGVQPRITSTYRTFAQQSRLYADFTAGRAKYPVAPPGTSAHEFGFAFDVDLAIDGANLSDLGKVWESWGGVWGGHYGDPVHFEFPGFKAGPSIVAKAGCSKAKSLLAGAVDVVLGFAPYLGELELAAYLVSLGFPQSQIAAFLKSPASYLACHETK